MKYIIKGRNNHDNIYRDTSCVVYKGILVVGKQVEFILTTQSLFFSNYISIT